MSFINGFISGKDLCKFLGYEKPIIAERHLFQRNKELLKNYISEKLNLDDKVINRYYNQVGAALLIMKSRTEKAEELTIFIATQINFDKD